MPWKSGSTTGFGGKTAPMTDRLPSQRVPKYRKHKATGQAVVTLQGKDHYLGKHGTAASREAYSRLIAEWLERGRQTTTPSRNKDQPALTPPTVNDLILGYLRHSLDYYKDSAAERDRIRLALRPLRTLYGRADAVAFGPLAFRAVQAEMAKTLARRTVNHRAGVIKRMVRWAVANELIPPSVFEGLRAVEGLKKGRSAARETAPVRPVSDVVVEKTLPFLSPHVPAMVEVQRLTGTRSGELCVMRSGDIDRTADVWVYKPSQHKTAHRGQDRTIFIGPKAQAVLTPLLSGLGPHDYVFSPRRMTEERYAAMRQKRVTNVPSSQRTRKKRGARRRPGDCYDARSYCHAVRKGCERGGIESWHPHQLRHAAATEMRKQFGIEVARVVLGQRHVNTTELYAQQDGDKAREAIVKLG